MTEQEYRNYPAVNKSTLWHIRKSPAHYKYALETPSPDTPALRFGRAVHAAVLTPNAYFDSYAVAPECDRRTKEGKETFGRFMVENADKEILTMADSIEVMAMATAVHESDAARMLLSGCEAEKPIFWTDQMTGLPCKCRVDAIKPGYQTVIDLKTCADASTDSFVRDAIKYGYDVQAAHYIRGAKSINGGKPVTWYFIAVEKTPPYAVNVMLAGDAFLDRGTWRLMTLMEKLKTCIDADEWPSYGQNELILPAWAEIVEEE